MKTEDCFDRFTTEILPAFMQALKDSDGRIDRVNNMIESLTRSDREQTEIFVRQIEKLSSRLDEAYAEVERLTKILAHQQESYSRLYALLEKELLSKSQIINNSNN